MSLTEKFIFCIIAITAVLYQFRWPLVVLWAAAMIAEALRK